MYFFLVNPVYPQAHQLENPLKSLSFIIGVLFFILVSTNIISVELGCISLKNLNRFGAPGPIYSPTS